MKVYLTHVYLPTDNQQTDLHIGNENTLREQGISIYITSLPINLHSGIQPLDDDVSVQFDGDTRHFLTDSHPSHINEPTMYWNVPLRELIWNPPTYKPWIGSWAFPPRT